LVLRLDLTGQPANALAQLFFGEQDFHNSLMIEKDGYCR
jgi:hypothetical protein